MGDEFVPANIKENVLAEWAHVYSGAEADTPSNSNVMKNKSIQHNMWLTVSDDHGTVLLIQLTI